MEIGALKLHTENSWGRASFLGDLKGFYNLFGESRVFWQVIDDVGHLAKGMLETLGGGVVQIGIEGSVGNQVHRQLSLLEQVQYFVCKQMHETARRAGQVTVLARTGAETFHFDSAFVATKDDEQDC
jgi:hypothetical protein